MKVISHVQLFKALFVPTLGELRGRLLNQQTYPGVQLRFHEKGIQVDFQSKCFVIPYGNVECVVLEDTKPGEYVK